MKSDFVEMSNETGIHSSDIIGTMLENKMLKYRNGNYLINKVSSFYDENNEVVVSILEGHNL